MHKRYQIFKDFQEYVQNKDDRPMDDICANQNTTFFLQAQQRFLREYMQKYPAWKSLLLYHEIGSGKTCTAITMAEEYLRVHPNNKVKVILPARLRTNFIDELISPCGMEAYISNEDFVLFQSPDTSAAMKKRIKSAFMKKIHERYDVMSFEKFKIEALKHRETLADWSREFTKDSMIIVDEVHNLLSDKHVRKNTDIMVKEGYIPKVNAKGMNTILFKFITKYAHDSCKQVFLTATPIFDNIQQLKELALAMNPDFKIDKKTSVKDVIEAMRGKVSYFPGTSVNAYPAVSYVDLDVPMSRTQQSNVIEIIDPENGEDGDDEKNTNSEAFFAKQRQIGIACLPDNEAIKPNKIDRVLSKMKEYCPKIGHLIERINKEKKGKHLVYSNFIKSGLHIVEAALKANGWVDLLDVINDAEKWRAHENKVYAFWDGSVNDAQKQTIKAVANAKNNIFGDKVRVILGSPSMKEGISFKHIQFMHILDPVWNQSAIAQVEGRAIRYCSHIDINEREHAPLKRAVTVFKYRSVPNARYYWPDGRRSCDIFIYNTVIQDKHKLVAAAESALKKVAIDYYLFRKLYSQEEKPDPTSPHDKNLLSPIEYNHHELVDLMWNKEAKVKEASTCPPRRRPDRSGNCPPGMVMKLNKQQHKCCYKMKKSEMALEKKEKKAKAPKTKMPRATKAKATTKAKA